MMKGREDKKLRRWDAFLHENHVRKYENHTSLSENHARKYENHTSLSGNHARKYENHTSLSENHVRKYELVAFLRVILIWNRFCCAINIFIVLGNLKFVSIFAAENPFFIHFWFIFNKNLAKF
jgi:hypothetical protein